MEDIVLDKIKITHNNEDYILVVSYANMLGKIDLSPIITLLKNDIQIVSYWFCGYIRYRNELINYYGDADYLSDEFANKIIEETNKVIKTYRAFI